jgi:3-carboxy-cis,cis-muconate cycloisomerase
MSDRGGLFDALYASDAVLASTDDTAWLQAMLDVEAAIARAGAKAGLVPPASADAIAASCVAGEFDAADIGRRSVASATWIVPLVAELRARVPPSARGFVHLGATSQDVIDTAMSLVAARTIDAITPTLVDVAASLADLTRAHRDTLQIGRTLLQHAAPTTFGLVCAGWLTGVDEALVELGRVRRERLAVQFGGAVGTLATYGDEGAQVAELLADELDLVAPTMPWHTTRVRTDEAAAALGIVAGSLAGIAGDVALLSGSDVGEVAEGAPGGSSAMPYKRNPSRAVLVTACTHQVPALVATMLGAAAQEHQRAAGRWQAEWPTMTSLLRLVGAAATHARSMLSDLRVDGRRMRANLDAAGDVVLADAVVARLASAIGRTRAASVVAEATVRAVRAGTTMRAALVDLAPDATSIAFPGPEDCLGATAVWIDRALAVHEEIRASAAPRRRDASATTREGTPR